MIFNELSAKLSNSAGQARMFQLAVTGIILWAITGPIFHYNDTWQLIINLHDHHYVSHGVSDPEHTEP